MKAYRTKNRILFLETIQSKSKAQILCRRCNSEYLSKSNKVLKCQRKTIGHLSNCFHHKKKDAEYASTIGNYSLDKNASLVLRNSNIFPGVRGLFATGIFSTGDKITTYPQNPDPSLEAINQYKIFTTSTSPEIIGLTEPKLGLGMGSFVNSIYGSKEKKNVDLIYEKGVMYVVALKRICYNEELLTVYGCPYNYKGM
jgi:hypothetical protein